MFAYYPQGTFYKKHLDQHRHLPHRFISCILYLSPWKPGNGGELRMETKRGTKLIEPLQNRFVTFLSSQIPHEVLPILEGDRYSLTSWLRDDLDLFTKSP